MLERGDRVQYTREHWEWMKQVGLHADTYRMAFRGTCMGDECDGCVLVSWDEGRPWPARRKSPQIASHLTENIELA